jgi:nitrite reductase (NADH) large subunit
VCGASRAEFEVHAEESAPKPAAPAGQWQCLNCNYIHAGAEPVEFCPVCGAPKERFQPLAVAGEGATASAAKTRVVVVGAGIAGISAMESLRSACPDAKIALVSKEEVLPYFRLNLTRYLAGEVQKDELPLHDPDWYEAQRIEVHLGAEITGLDVEDKTIALRDGRSLPFEKLILTIGSHPFIPPFPGAQRDGVASFRTLDDAERLLEAAKTGMKCICIGGGILGLETAGALARQGVDVTLLESHDWLMPRQLNPEAGARLKAFAEGVGIRILEQSRTAEIVGDERAAGVRLEDGTLIDGDLVVITDPDRRRSRGDHRGRPAQQPYRAPRGPGSEQGPGGEQSLAELPPRRVRSRRRGGAPRRALRQLERFPVPGRHRRHERGGPISGVRRDPALEHAQGAGPEYAEHGSIHARRRQRCGDRRG